MDGRRPSRSGPAGSLDRWERSANSRAVANQLKDSKPGDERRWVPGTGAWRRPRPTVAKANHRGIGHREMPPAGPRASGTPTSRKHLAGRPHRRATHPHAPRKHAVVAGGKTPTATATRLSVAVVRSHASGRSEPRTSSTPASPAARHTANVSQYCLQLCLESSTEVPIQRLPRRTR
jgi:hypothetical protein